MKNQTSENVTALLKRWRDGEQEAYQQLYPLVYDELKRQAHHYLRRERNGHTLQTTDLVHEVYLKLQAGGQAEILDRESFFGFAAAVMRRVLVEWARRRKRTKRGGDCTRVTFDEAIKITPDNYDEIVALDDALQALAQFDAYQCRIVELRHFGGLTVKETAAVLGVSVDHVNRQWRSARLWLYRELNHRT
jgi:RNA polymerase sigma factor (TIGR02999 family)